MFTTYLILVSSIAAVTIVWRTFKDDHPAFKAWVRSLPLVGESLSCGVCVSFWFSLPAIFFLNPLMNWQSLVLLDFLCGWMSVSIGVLAVRSFVIVLLEGAAVLKHGHLRSHQ